MIKKLKSSYLTGKIDRKEYGKKMFEQYENLFEYVTLLSESDVRHIEITKKGISVGINSLDESGKSIKMNLYPEDAGSVPATCLSFGQYEKQELCMVKKLISYIDTNGIAFDIGANLGWYTLNLLQMKNSLTCYSFEPVKNIFDQLIDNLSINGADTTKTFNHGFYNTNTELEFYYNKKESGSSSLANIREIDQSNKIICSVQRLDDFVNNEGIDRLDFIKCDVEGAELFVFEGALESIKKYKPIIFTEMLRKWSAKFGYHPNDIMGLFTTIGYDCFIIEDEHLTQLKKVDEDTLATNYFFLNRERHQDIIRDLGKV